MFGRSIKQGIEGSMKGKMLMKADLVRPKPDFVVYYMSTLHAGVILKIIGKQSQIF